VSEIFEALAGQWRLERTFSPGLGTMTGTARFRPVRDGVLHYREDGRVTFANGHTGDAFREYHYLLDPDGTIRVCYVEPNTFGRTLHALHLDGTVTEAVATHLCGADTYVGRYAFALPDRFTIDMDVSGPAKDYSTHTVFEREP
jgi:hypothetical protein